MAAQQTVSTRVTPIIFLRLSLSLKSSNLHRLEIKPNIRPVIHPFPFDQLRAGVALFQRVMEGFAVARYR